jgi:hypothetical protein
MKIFQAFIAIIIAATLVTYFDLKNQKEKEVMRDAKIIKSILCDNFEEVEKVLIIIGQEIGEKTPNLDLKIIHKIFLQAAQVKNDVKVLPWTMFDWVNLDGYQTVNTVIGVRSDPPEIARYRNYRSPANELWRIIFSEPATGEPSKLYVIPVGVQISTEKYPQAGTVTSSINIKKLVNQIKSGISSESHFAVIDKRSETIVMSSYKTNHKRGAVYSNEYSLNADDNYIYSQEMANEKYPYLVKVGYNKKEFWSDVRFASAKLSFQIFATALTAFFLLKRKR